MLPTPLVSTLTSSGVSAVGWLAKVRIWMLARSAAVRLSTFVTPGVNVTTALLPGGIGRGSTSPFGVRSTTVLSQVARPAVVSRKAANAPAKLIGEVGPTLATGCRVTSSTRGEAS